MDHISKFGEHIEFSGNSTIINFFFESPLYIPKKNETFTSLSTMNQKRNILSLMIGYGYLSQSDGHPDHQGYTTNKQNLVHLPFFGLAYFSKLFNVRLGHLYGMYGITEQIYDDKTKTYIDAGGYFNYSSTSWKDDADGGHPMLKGLSSSYTAGDTYNRIHLSGEITLPWFTLPFGKSTNFNLKSSYDSYGIKAKFFHKNYIVNAYMSRSQDLEGDKRFGIIQIGLEQRLILSRLLGTLSFIRLNVNHTKMDATAFSDISWKELKKYDSDKYFYEAEFSYSFILLSGWYNLKNDYGFGFGLVSYQQRLINYYIRGKYNPYAPYAVYQRALNEGGWSFELGVQIDLYGVLELQGWL